jgi:hypothetical protein
LTTWKTIKKKTGTRKTTTFSQKSTKLDQWESPHHKMGLFVLIVYGKGMKNIPSGASSHGCGQHIGQIQCKRHRRVRSRQRSLPLALTSPLQPLRRLPSFCALSPADVLGTAAVFQSKQWGVCKLLGSRWWWDIYVIQKVLPRCITHTVGELP